MTSVGKVEHRPVRRIWVGLGYLEEGLLLARVGDEEEVVTMNNKVAAEGVRGEKRRKEKEKEKKKRMSFCFIII